MGKNKDLATQLKEILDSVWKNHTDLWKIIERRNKRYDRLHWFLRKNRKWKAYAELTEALYDALIHLEQAGGIIMFELNPEKKSNSPYARD